jgi:D-alanine transaminase
MRTYRGRIFRLEAHLDRFERSAAALEIMIPYTREKLADTIAESHRRSGYPESKIYMQLTRGTAERGHAYAEGLIPTFLITVLELHPVPAPMIEKGVAVITLEDIRWGRCDIKSTNLLPNVMAQQKARRAAAFEAVMIRNGKVTEGAVSNFFMIRNERLVTSPVGQGILSGVTRDAVIGLARELKIPVEERDIAAEEIVSADELFLSGTTIEIVPAVTVDGKPVGSGLPGPLTRRLMKEFRIMTRVF